MRRSASFEAGVAEARELHAALVERQRLLERQVALFELLDDRFQLGDRRFEVLDGGFGHVIATSTTKDTTDTKEVPLRASLVSFVLRVSRRRPSQSNSPCERHLHRIAGRDVGRRRARRGAIAGPADGVAAGQDRERAERVEAAGDVSQLRRRAMLAARHRAGQAAVVHRDEPAMDSGSRRPTSNNPSWRCSCCSRRSRAARPARITRAAVCVRSAAWRPRIATRPGKPANAGRPPIACTRRLRPCTRARARRRADRAADRCGCRTRPSRRRRSRRPPTASAPADRRRSRRS